MAITKTIIPIKIFRPFDLPMQQIAFFTMYMLFIPFKAVLRLALGF